MDSPPGQTDLERVAAYRDEMRERLPKLTREYVRNARDAGESWADIARQLRTSERAAMKWLEKP